MREWRPFAEDARQSWATFAAKVRDARVHRELRWVIVVIGGPALWAWWVGSGQLRRGAVPLGVRDMLGLTVLPPAAFLIGTALELRRRRKERARELAVEELERKRAEARQQHGIKRGDLKTYKLVGFNKAKLWGLPDTGELQEIARGPNGELYGIDHGSGEIRPAHEPDPGAEARLVNEAGFEDPEPAKPASRVRRRHSKFEPLT